MKFISFLLSGFILLSPALSAEQDALAKATLRENVTISNEIVTLGDLVENTGIAANTPVFRAPDLGTRGAVSVWRIEEAALKAGIANLDTLGLSSVTVQRAARSVRPDHVHDIIQETIADKMRVANINAVSVTFDDKTPDTLVENSSKAAPVISRIDWNPATSRFEAMVSIPDSRATMNNPILYRGTAVEMVNVAVLKRDISRGTSISSDDFTIETLPRTKLSTDSITDVKSLEGISAKRQINAGQNLRLSDVERTRKVQKNDMVTIMFETSGITLSTRGKAMADGALGDVVAVQNTQSKKILEGKIVGAGMVAIQASHSFLRTKNIASTSGYIN